MAEFSENEKKLLKSIPEKSPLRTSLQQLREASERIWAPDAPRIIRDYTDHGIHHSERIAFYASELLKANRGKKLSPEEMYLLLAGIYLHDIGMQCDVGRHPEIKERAQHFGARFDIAFTAQRSSDYSVDEQKAIRKNHHYLSIAWIDYAKCTQENVLSHPAQSIPNALVDDLMDVCKHHTSLPIGACPLEFQRNQRGRKRLVAALLRFADELDIAANRVTIEVVQDFNLDPSNAIYWWLHNRTEVTFPVLNAVKVQVWLHPDDSAHARSIVQSAYIDNFRQKNEPVLTVLAENSIPIVIHAQSEVMETVREDLFPQEIREALQALSGQHQRIPSTPENADSSVNRINTAHQEVVDRQGILLAARRLRVHLDAVAYQLADPDLRPQDCDTTIGNLDAARSVLQELDGLLNTTSLDPDFTVAASAFRVLRHSFNQSLKTLKTRLSQFRGSCPPTLPADRQQRESLHKSSIHQLSQLTLFEKALPSDSVTAVPPLAISTLPTSSVNATSVRTPTSGPAPASQKFGPLQLAKLLSEVGALSTYRQRTQIIELMKDHLKIAGMDRNDANDLFDILAIVKTCIRYDNGLPYLVQILRAFEGDSLPLRQVIAYLEM